MNNTTQENQQEQDTDGAKKYQFSYCEAHPDLETQRPKGNGLSDIVQGELTFNGILDDLLKISNPTLVIHKINSAYITGINTDEPYQPKRSKQITHTSFLTIDGDSTIGQTGDKFAPSFESAVEAIQAVFPNTLFAAHTTWKNMNITPKWRIFIPLSRPVNKIELSCLYTQTILMMVENGCPVAFANECSSPANAWFLPSRKTTYEYATNRDGEDLDVDTFLNDYLVESTDQKGLPAYYPTINESNNLRSLPSQIGNDNIVPISYWIDTNLRSYTGLQLSDKAQLKAIDFIREEMDNPVASQVHYAISTGYYSASGDRLIAEGSENAAGISMTEMGRFISSHQDSDIMVKTLGLKRYELIDMLIALHPAFKGADKETVMRCFADWVDEASHPLQPDFYYGTKETRLNNFTEAYKKKYQLILEKVDFSYRKKKDVTYTLETLRTDDENLVVNATESEEYTIDCMPPSIFELASEIARKSQTVIDLPFLSLMSHISIVAQRQIRVEMYAMAMDDDDSAFPTLFPLLWSMIIASSGERKTTVDGFVTKPIKAFDKEMRPKNKKKMEAYEKTIDNLKSELSMCQSNIKRMRRLSDEERDEGQLADEIKKSSEINKQITNTKRPILENLINTVSGSFNGWCRVIETNRCSIISSDEAGNVIGSYAAQNQALPLFSMFNTCYSPNTGATNNSLKDRNESVDKDEEYAYGLCLSLQPDIWNRFREMDGGIVESNGTIARFSISRPRSKTGNRSRPNIQNMSASEIEERRARSKLSTTSNKYFNEYCSVISKMLTLPLETYYEDDRFIGPIIETTGEAQKLFQVFQDWVEEQQRHDDGEALKGIKARLPEKAMKYAAVFEYYEHYRKNSDMSPIQLAQSLETLKIDTMSMRCAINAMTIEYKNAVSEFKPAIDCDEDKIEYYASKIWKWLKKHRPDGVCTIYDIKNKCHLKNNKNKRISSKNRMKCIDYLIYEGFLLMSDDQKTIFYNKAVIPTVEKQPWDEEDKIAA